MRAWYRDRVALGAAGIAGVALLVGLALWLARARILRWGLRSGVAISAGGTLAGFERHVATLQTASLAIAVLALAYLVVGRGLVRLTAGGATSCVIPAPGRATRIERILALGILCVATILRLAHIHRDFEGDEYFTIIHFVAAPTWWDTVSRYYLLNNHVGHSVLARLAYVALDDAEWVVRLPALLLGLGGVVTTWWLGRRWIGVYAALVASAALALLPMHVQYSRAARGYTGLALLTIIATHSYLLHKFGERRPGALGFVAAHAAGIYLHLYAAWVFIVQVLDFASTLLASSVRRTVCGLALDRWRQLWWAFPATAIAVAALYAPVAEELGRQITGMPRTAIRPELPRQVIEALLGTGVYWQMAWLLVVVAAGMAALVRRRLALGLHLGAILVLPLLIVWLVLRPQTVFDRFFLFMAPIVAWLIGAGFVGIWTSLRLGPRATMIARAAMMGAMAPIVWTWVDHAMVASYGPPYRAVVARLVANAPAHMPLCVFGADAQGLQYFTSRPLTVVRTQRDLDRLLARKEPFRCVYVYVPWLHDDEQAIARRLATETRSTTFSSLTLYEWP